MAQTTSRSCHFETLFYKLSLWAIRQGLMTARERDAICRRGHRKHGYWRRHLRDLQAWIEYRRASAVRAARPEELTGTFVTCHRG